jgi:hypothetical protein
MCALGVTAWARRPSMQGSPDVAPQLWLEGKIPLLSLLGMAAANFPQSRPLFPSLAYFASFAPSEIYACGCWRSREEFILSSLSLRVCVCVCARAER